jgi:glycosyltransferase involved in cell wall biosynthesis
VITVHDLSVLTTPWHHTRRNLLLTGPQMLLSLHRATRLIAISQATARDLARLPGLDPARIRVIPQAHDPSLAPASPQAIEDVVRRLNLPRPFFLFLGGLGPNKNVMTALRAMKSLWATGERRARLVIAGAVTPHTWEVRRMVRQLDLDDAVHFAGYVAQPDLPALYGASTALVYPSLSEGFGLPPLEAMACGTPVLCSNAASLPEVVGDAALLVDPRSIADLAAALRSLLNSKDLRDRLRDRGLTRAALFSAEKMARQTVEVYREAAAEHAT